MSGGERGDMEAKTPKWESKLWSYMSSGNGEYCPTRQHCRNKRQGNWCPDEDKERLYALFDKKRCALSDCDFVAKGECGFLFPMVQRLARRYLKKGRISGPPVPCALISLIPEQHKVEIRSLPLKAYHGAIWYLQGKWIIQLNRNDTPGRKRFTLFHEAFHILAHHSQSTPVFKRIGSPYGSFNELVADYFAICILMPKEWVVQEWAKCHDFNHMVKTFNVPEPSMRIRLKRLGLI